MGLFFLIKSAYFGNNYFKKKVSVTFLFLKQGFSKSAYIKEKGKPMALTGQFLEKG